MNYSRQKISLLSKGDQVFRDQKRGEGPQSYYKSGLGSQ